MAVATFAMLATEMTRLFSLLLSIQNLSSCRYDGYDAIFFCANQNVKRH